MTTHTTNPFVLPGFGQSGEFAANPVMASMEMMRKAWQSLAGQGGLGAPSMAATLSAEELERRITDLRAVENWLRMNLTVLSSTIQGLEVQRATLATLKSFVHNTQAATGQSGQAAKKTSESLSGSPSTARAQASAQDGGTARTPPLFDTDQAVAATQAWWDALRQQFDSLAAATAASMPAPAAAPDTPPAATPGKTTQAKPKAGSKSRSVTKPATAR